jgi:hypothetical protein
LPDGLETGRQDSALQPSTQFWSGLEPALSFPP